MPIWLPIGNYYFIGPRYFTEARVFWWGTLLEMVLYWFSIFSFTQVIRRIFRRFPHIHQTPIRTGVILVVLGLLMVVEAMAYVYVFSLFPLFEAPFDWGTVRSIIVIGACFDVFFCIVLSAAYLYGQWQENQQEREQLKRSALQHQFDLLKGQINPDLLFDSLGSLTDLIGQDTIKAEKFVEELARVYRYLLRANQQPPVTLAEEITFTRAYSALLQVRYGAGLVVSVEEPAEPEAYRLPPLTMQLLLDGALKHCRPPIGKPLRIRFSVEAGQLRMIHDDCGQEGATLTAQQAISLPAGNQGLLDAGSVEVHFREGLRIVEVPLTTTTTPIPQ